LRALSESLPVILFSAGADGWVDWYSRRWHEYTGQTFEEAAGWGWQAVHHPDDLLDVMRNWPHSISTGEPFEMEVRLRRNDGTFHWFLARAEPFRDATGAIHRWYGSIVDIDAQKFSIERSKRLAETLHEIFLPKTLPQYADLRLDAMYLSAEKDALVGGDWYDAFELPDGRLIVSIGDVAGHGLEASITVGRLRQAIYTMAWRGDDPGTILKEADRILSHQDPGTMVTAIVGSIDAAHATLRYALAGHPPPMIARTKGKPAEVLPFGDPPLGIGLNIDPQTHVVPIARDSVVALYTDGVIEFSRDAVSVEKKLAKALSSLVGNPGLARPARALAEKIFEGVRPFDDAALLLLQFSATRSDVDDDPVPLEKVWRFHSSSAHTAQASRREVMAYLHAMAPACDNLFEVELIVGELFANTVQHAPGLVEVRVEWSKERPQLTVRDTGPGLEFLIGRLPENVLSENGRGLFLLKTLASGVTVKSRPGYGTELRAVLPISRALHARSRSINARLRAKPQR
jgi:PAS domain S-box-containing protein